MMEALTAGGQFAHVDRLDMEVDLEWLWEDERLEEAEFEGEDRPLYEMAVPLDLLRVARQHPIPPVYKGDAIRYIGARHGCICALCFAVQRHPEVAKWEDILLHDAVGLRFYRFVCPTWWPVLWREGFEIGFSAPPICRKCLRSIIGLPVGPHTSRSEEVWPLAVAQLMKLTSFQRRLEANSHRQLRFDPRRA
jgi:hypothetical protein